MKRQIIIGLTMLVLAGMLAGCLSPEEIRLETIEKTETKIPETIALIATQAPTPTATPIFTFDFISLPVKTPVSTSALALFHPTPTLILTPISSLTPTPTPTPTLTPTKTPSLVLAVKKKIEISLGQRMLWCWEEEEMVFSTPISSAAPVYYGADGRTYYPRTSTGTFEILQKIELLNMGCGNPNLPYCLPNVPWNMVFSESYIIHGAYWHDDFGVRDRSFGCVNVSVEAARWIYEWAPIGTKVIVYD